MTPEAVTALYDQSYAAEYDQRFLLPDYTSPITQHELSILKRLLGEGSKWLDVGCGTGFYLACFPNVDRIGLDISAAMLNHARARTPRILVRQGDFREAFDDWEETFTLVSCMWAAYAYVDTIGDVERAVANMIRWTTPGGALFLPIIDLLHLRRTDLDHRQATSFFSGQTVIDGCIWSWEDAETGKAHRNLVAPHTDQILEWLSPWYEAVELINYPAVGDQAIRQALLATGRRSRADFSKPAVVKRAVSPLPSAPPLSSVPIERLLAEFWSRLRPRYIYNGVVARFGRSA